LTRINTPRAGRAGALREHYGPIAGIRDDPGDGRLAIVLLQEAVLTGRPADRVDAKVLQVLIDLDAGTKLAIGLRVDAYFLGAPSSRTQ
jgi:hypothetical protein